MKKTIHAHLIALASLPAVLVAILTGCTATTPPSTAGSPEASRQPVAITSARVQPDRPGPASAESSWIKAEVGASEGSLGARVETVEAVPDSDSVAVSIALPPDDRGIEEITVYGRAQKPSSIRLPISQPRKVEVLSSPEKNGIIIYLPKVQDFVLRINYYEAQPDVVPDVIND